MSAPIRRKPKPHAVLIDGSALFFASRLREDLRLNYFELISVLIEAVPGLRPPGEDESSLWTMWTASDPRNSGQAKFLEFAEQRLQWNVRRALPQAAYTVEPEVLFGLGAVDLGRASRLIRFDAPIAFAIGRLAETHRIIVVSDSFALSDTMLRVDEAWGPANGQPVLAFFGYAIDSRWRPILRGKGAHGFVDLDDHEARLFGLEQSEGSSPDQQPGKFVY